MCLKYQNKNKQPSHCKTLIGYVGTSWTHNLSITLLLNTTVLPRKKLTSTRISLDSCYAQRKNKRNTLYFSIPFFMLLCTFIAQAVKELLMKHNSLSAEGIIRVHSCYVVVIINMHYIIQKISSVKCILISDREFALTNTEERRKAPNSIRRSLTKNICKNGEVEAVCRGPGISWPQTDDGGLCLRHSAVGTLTRDRATWLE